MNTQLIDMTPESINKRKEQRAVERAFAEEIWETLCNEGDTHEKEYWIKGFIAGLKYEIE
jgi:hypothetical protein